MDVIDLFFDDLAEEAASPEIEGTLWYERVYERGVRGCIKRPQEPF
jgi:hypothetical protein